MRRRPPSDLASARQRVWLRHDLLRALDQEQVIPYFQPKVDLASGRVDGVEILARWAHPTLGIVGPDEFIVQMENHGMIDQLTDSMLKQALACARHWSGAGFELDLALNVAPGTLQQAGVAERLLRIVKRHGMAPARLTIEMTETSAASDPHGVLDTATRLRAHGFNIAIDDFGTRCSTLLQLKDLPVTELKIDRAFVTNLPLRGKAAAILESILYLSEKLGLRTVAEGIETLAELDFLRARGCTAGQGYLFARPMPHTGLMAWLQAGQAGGPAGSRPSL